MNSELFPLLLITLLAVGVPFLSRWMRPVILPIVVGEIIAGIIIGKSGFDLVRPTEALSFLSEFGFSFLMFLSGLEMNFEQLLEIRGEGNTSSLLRRPLFLSGVSFLLTLVLAIAIGFILTRHGLARHGLLMGLILSTTSLGVVVPVLKERGFTMTPYGKVLLLSSLIGDFVTLLLLSLIIALISHGASMELMLTMLLLAVFVVAVILGQRARRIPLLSRTIDELSHATAQIQVRGAFALMVAWVFLAMAMGVQMILGAFLAGALISLISRGEEQALQEKLEAIGYGFFIPIFFIMVGAGFDLRALFSSRSALLLVPILIGASYLVKIGPTLIFRIVFTWRETLAGGILLSSRLSLIIAAAAIALNLSLISPATNSAVILVAVFTCTLSPVIFSRMVSSPVEQEREGTIIMGTDQLAVFLGERLVRTGEQVTFVTGDGQQLARLRNRKFNVVLGQPEDEETLDSAGASRASALIAVFGNPEIKQEACRLARMRFGIPNVIALADEQGLVTTLEEMGVNVVQSSMATALALEGALHFPSAFKMLTDLTEGIEFAEGVMLNRALAGRPLRRVRLPGSTLVLGLRREGEALLPHGDTILKLWDVITLVGPPEDLREAKRLIQLY